MSVVTFEHVGYTYSAKTPFEHEALKDLSFTLQEGRVTGLVGHTGCGKSTVAMLLDGLERPTSGRILIDGRDLWEEPKKVREIRRRIGLVFQYPEYQLFEETVEKDIAFGPRNLGKSEDEIRTLVHSAAQFVGVGEDLLKKSPFELSGGERRRAAIAGVLAMDPELLVLDEPAAGLDPRGRADILGGVCAYRREKQNRTVLLISHSMEDMARFADDLIVLKEGELLFHGTTKEVFCRPDLVREAGLALPQITRITNALCDLGIPEGITTTEEAAIEILKRLDS